MKLIFDWCNSFHEEKSTWNEDEELISLEIDHREYNFAFAKISIKTKNFADVFKKKYAKIAVKHEDNTIEVIFSGKLLSFPTGVISSSINLEFISEPDDYQRQLDQFVIQNLENDKKINKHIRQNNKIVFDELFFASQNIKNPTIFLESQNEIFYWDKVTGRMTLSNVIHGNNNIDISDNHIIQNSIKIRLAREPYSCVNLKISANWIQCYDGTIDVLPMIAKKFNYNIMNSFTNIKQAIEKKYNLNMHGNYLMTDCKIVEVKPNTDGIRRFPEESDRIIVKNKQTLKEKSVHFHRFYFKGRIVFYWKYQQKRLEKVNLIIKNNDFPNGKEKILDIKLNLLKYMPQLSEKNAYWMKNIMYYRGEKIIHDNSIFECKKTHESTDDFESSISNWGFIQKNSATILDSACGSFFATNRGKNAIYYAMQKSLALLNFSSRYIEISFSIPAENFLHLTLNDQITIISDKFENNKITGKIIRINFIAKYNKRILKVTVACRMKALLIDNFEKISSYNIDINDNSTLISENEIVQNIEIINPPIQQAAILAKTTASSVPELKNILKKMSTKIRLTMHPLNTNSTAVREINLPLLEV